MNRSSVNESFFNLVVIIEIPTIRAELYAFSKGFLPLLISLKKGYLHVKGVKPFFEVKKGFFSAYCIFQAKNFFLEMFNCLTEELLYDRSSN